MDILLYLTELLQTRKTVGIVGLGTLYKKKSPGKYDVEQHAFVPPTYNITFTTEIKEQEELANYISNKRNITVESANYYIGEFVEQVQAQLAENQEANLEPIGKLKLINDEITLVAEQESNFGFEFYGLPTLTEITAKQENLEEVEIPEPSQTEQLEEIEDENRLEEENPGQETDENIEENVLVNDEQETFEEIAEVENRPTANTQNTFIVPPVIETAEVEEKEEPELVVQNEVTTEENIEEEEPKKGMPFFMKFLIVLLIIIAAGAVAYFINPTFFNNYLKNSEGKHDQSISVAPVDSLNTKKADSLQSDSLAKTNDMVKLAVDTPAIDSSKVTVFEVLVSAVATEKKANKIIANLTKQGITAKKIKLSKTMINISAGTFLEEYPAKLYRDSLRKVLKNEGVYIQPIQPKTHKK